MAFAELGLWHWLYHLSADNESDLSCSRLTKRSSRPYSHYHSYVQPKHSHNSCRPDPCWVPNSVKTLETYLDYGSSLVDAAQALFIHRNTLLHRSLTL